MTDFDFRALLAQLPEMRRRADDAAVYVSVNPLRRVITGEHKMTGIAEVCHARVHPEDGPHEMFDCCDQWVIETGSISLAALWHAALTDVPLLLDAIEQLRTSRTVLNPLPTDLPQPHTRMTVTCGQSLLVMCDCGEGYASSDAPDSADRLRRWMAEHAGQEAG